jgi:signal transduction histidine kinase
MDATRRQPSHLEALPHTLPPDLLHDLRTPLNQIIGYSEMLLEQAQEQGQTDLVSDLEKTRAAGRTMLALLNTHFQPVGSAFEPPTLAESRSALSPTAPGEPLSDPGMSDTPGVQTGARILVVDDVEANRDLLTRRLQQQGCVVTAVTNGREALESLRAETFDLVLLDIMMPEMDGYEVLRCVKADPLLCRLPVIMISALSEMDSVARCIEMGAEDYLPKPFNPILLKARIGACLEKKRVRDQDVRLHEELQRSYQRLQELEKGRADLTHMIVHDLRTPLNAMMMSLQGLPYLGDLNAEQEEMVEVTRKGGETLIGMINDLLGISQMESGALRLDYQAVTAAHLLAVAVKQVAPLAAAQGLTLTTTLEQALPTFLADESVLLRVLVNLLGNAIKFTPRNGTVAATVQFDAAGPLLLFAVKDSGEGIPSESFGHIFEKFGQVESREGGKSMSTGLGLTFCKLAVERHGGRISVESVRGQGSTFQFTIPLSQSTRSVAA